MINLYNSDCLDTMKYFDDKSIDCIITSPPYNIGKDFKESGNSDRRDNYIEWMIDVLKECTRISKSIWLNTGYRKLPQGNIPIIYQLYDKIDMYFVQRIIWEYDAGLPYKKRFAHRSEDWSWFVDNPNNYIFNGDDVRDLSLQKGAYDKRNNPNGKLPTDVWFYNRVAGNAKKRYDHPTQYPPKLIERIVKACTNENDIILDPFLGSGTTGVIAKQLNRRFIGIEISEYYYNMALERISNE